MTLRNKLKMTETKISRTLRKIDEHEQTYKDYKKTTEFLNMEMEKLILYKNMIITKYSAEPVFKLEKIENGFIIPNCHNLRVKIHTSPKLIVEILKLCKCEAKIKDDYIVLETDCSPDDLISQFRENIACPHCDCYISRFKFTKRDFHKVCCNCDKRFELSDLVKNAMKSNYNNHKKYFGSIYSTNENILYMST